MKKPIMIFTVLMMSSWIQTAAHAEWIDARVTSINSTNQTMQVQHKTSTGISETMTINLDKNSSLEGYQGLGDVRNGDRVRLDVESSFLGIKTARVVTSAAAQANPSRNGPGRFGVVGTANQGLDSRLGAGASPRINAVGRTDLPAGSRAVTDVTKPTNNNPARPLLISNSNSGLNNPTDGEPAEDSVPSNSFNTRMNTGVGI